MSLPQGGFERRERSGGRRASVWCAVALALLGVWIWSVLSWGGGESGETGGGAAQGEAADRFGRGGGQSLATGASSIPDEPAYAEAGGSGEGALESLDEPAQGEPVPHPEAGDHDHHHPEAVEGAAGEPGSYDPLGTGTSTGDLAPTDEARVSYAAERFVMASYGYTGSDGAEYLAGVAETSLSPDLSLSEGGPEISRYAEQVGESGTKSAAKLTRFEFEEASPDSVVGRAYFETGEGYNPDGELEGEKIAYRQRMTLSRIGEVWKVRATEEIEEMPPLEEALSNEEER